MIAFNSEYYEAVTKAAKITGKLSVRIVHEGTCPLGTVKYGIIDGISNIYTGATTTIPVCFIMHDNKALTSFNGNPLFVVINREPYQGMCAMIGTGSNMMIMMSARLQPHDDYGKSIKVDINDLVTLYEPEEAN